MSLAGLRSEFLRVSRERRVVLFAVGGAWTGFDLHDETLPNGRTDVVMLNAAFGINSSTVSRLQRQASGSGHFEPAFQAVLLVRQALGRVVRSPDTPHNRRVHWRDARIRDSRA